MSQSFEISLDAVGMRIDVYLSNQTQHSRSKIAEMLKDGSIKCNDAICKANYKLKLNDVISVGSYKPKTKHLKAVMMDLDIIYEDDVLLVVNKPKGLSVHAGKGIYTPTLLNGLFYHMKPLKPGLVHRLDKDTSGLLVIAKDPLTHAFLANQLLDKTMRRDYVAIVEGHVESPLDIHLPIGPNPHNPQQMHVDYENGKNAQTLVYPDKFGPNHTLVRCILKTGRTHQIRIHLASIDHPIIEDSLYNQHYPNGVGQYLVANHLEFIHPTTLVRVVFEIDVPKDFLEMCQNLLIQ